jgi:hypothetical protein
MFLRHPHQFFIRDNGSPTPVFRNMLIGAGAGTLAGYAGRLALNNYMPDLALGSVPELLGAAGGAYLGYKLSPDPFDKGSAARLLLLHSYRSF